MVLGCTGPLGVVLYSAWQAGESHPVLMGLAVFLPIATVLRYTIQWHDTLTVSFVLSVCFAAHFWLGADLVGMEQVFRFLWLSVLGITLFLVLINPVCRLIVFGPWRQFSPLAKGRSTLDIQILRRAITLYPERASGRYKCGEADENGQFAVSTIIGQIDQLRYEPKSNMAAAAQITPEEEADGVDAHGRLVSEAFAKVVSAGPNHHEVQTYNEDAKGRKPEHAVIIRHDFTDLGARGIEVRQTEFETVLPYGAAFGFWITDFMSDGLTEEIDRAEGRKARANRCFVQHNLAVDLANTLVPLMGGKRIEPSSAP